MRIFAFLTFLLLLQTASAQEYAPEQIQSWVLEAISEMPRKGGYELTRVAPERMRDAFSWRNEDELGLNSDTATPSYCTTATYLVLYKVLQKYWIASGKLPLRKTLEFIKPNLEADGVRFWGRWNSNGPGTAKTFTDAGLGINFDDIKQAKAGDFLKIFWNNHVGKLERGHSVIFLGVEKRNGVEMIKFWGSSKDTDGYSERWIPRADAIRTLFSRLNTPENIDRLSTLPANDTFLSSMLTRVSSWTEVRKVSGISGN